MDSRKLAETLKDFLYDVENPIDERTTEWWRNKMRETIVLLTAEPEPCEDAAPAIDPISGMPFFMMIKHPEKGWVPTYGGPYDSYTLCERDDEGIETDVVGFTRERYDHDEGGWVEGGEILDCALVSLHKASQVSDKRAEELRAQVETLREFVADASEWSKAYSTDLWPDPTPEQVEKVCVALGFHIDRIAAMVLRQFTGRWSEKARALLAATEPKP